MLSREELVKLPRRKAYRSIVRFVFDKVRQSSVANLSDQERAIYLIASMHEEIRNGGISQHFTNPRGNESDLVLDALTQVGAPKQREIISRSFALLPPVKDHNVLGKFIFENASVMKEMDDLTGKYLATAEELYDLVTIYVLANPDAFRLRD